MVTRLKGEPRDVIMGYAYDNAAKHPILTFASTSPLDFEWGWSADTFNPPYGVTTWADKDTYPVPHEGYDWYFGWNTGTVTYEGETWYILLIDTYTWAGGTAITAEDGITMFAHAWENNPQDIGLTLLETAHAVPYTEVVTEIGTETYAFKYSDDDKTYTYIDTNGNALFKEITTDAGSLTSQMAQKQNLLTAGSNIQINGDIISATDTTYGEFDGDDAGLVPAVQTQSGKFLKDDGTWATPSGGGGGGTDVEANPSGSATSTLTKLRVDNIIYGISGGGEDSSIPLFDGTWQNQDIMGITPYLATIENGKLHCQGMHSGIVVSDVSGMTWSAGYRLIIEVESTNGFSYQIGQCTPTSDLDGIIRAGTNRITYTNDSVDNNKYIFKVEAIDATRGVFLGGYYLDSSTDYYITKISLVYDNEKEYT
jgi:hypothetical protein